jgi:LmbE family N-acetylglucosaminyl deacetylase
MRRSASKRLVRITKATVLSVAILLLAYFKYQNSKPVPISSEYPDDANDTRVKSMMSAKKVLFIDAHPDDIEWYCGGLVYMLRKQDAEVVFAVGTKGGKGHKGLSKKILEGLRSRHQLNAARILGGARVVLYNYPDKALGQHIEAFGDDLKTLIDKEKPDMVLSWDPDFIYNPHPDHVAAAKSARLAIEKANYSGKTCYYGTHHPNLWIGYGEDIFKIKLKSLSAHRTEMVASLLYYGKRYLVGRSRGVGKKIKKEYAETYRLAQ